MPLVKIHSRKTARGADSAPPRLDRVKDKRAKFDTVHFQGLLCTVLKCIKLQVHSSFLSTIEQRSIHVFKFT